MPTGENLNTAIIGTQWGDEGKGKLVDALSGQFDIVCRSAGGSNAGHTIVVDGTKYVFHMLPSGLLHENTIGVIGNGCVVHLPDLMKEVEELEKKGLNIRNRLKISTRAHVLFNYHREIDGRLEELKGKGKVGTTKQGIGPAYTDKAMRIGIRCGDIVDIDSLREKVTKACEFHNNALGLALDPETELAPVLALRDEVLPLLVDTRFWLNEQIKNGKTLLFEGAQAHHLDIDHGTYPYVTSSSTTIGGICTGLGIAPQKIGRVIGIAKAYTTRVGGGPFPTELEDETGAHLQNTGGEFGATTGRPRRCGWFDAVLVRESVMVNGITDVNLTKLDVLTGISEIKVATKYTVDGKELTGLPFSPKDAERIEVVYETLPGWEENIAEARAFEELPQNAQKYVLSLEKLIDASISSIGVGPDRDALVFRNT
jgi:adenylosuccinate synthase